METVMVGDQMSQLCILIMVYRQMTVFSAYSDMSILSYSR